MARHVHADLIEEWLNDTSIKLQCKRPHESDDEYLDVGRPSWNTDLKYRKKPREFQEGHWYPCIDDGNEESVYCYVGDGEFNIDGGSTCGNERASQMKWIGESLGKLKFG